MRRERNYLLIITLVTFYIWRPLLDMVLQGEGYMYSIPGDFDQYLRDVGAYHTFYNLMGMSLGAIMTRAFGTRMELYFVFEIGAILLTNIALFFMVRTILKNSFAAFLSIVIFASNFFSLSDIYHPSRYGGVFLERFPLNFPFMLVSFLLLHAYLEKNQIRLYIYSAVLYFFAVFIAHYSIYFAFPFFLYPVFFRFFKKVQWRASLRGMLVALPYILIAIFFILNHDKGLLPVPKRDLFEFRITPQISRYPESMLRQLVYISQIPAVLKALLTGSRPLALSSSKDMTPFITPILIAYIVSFVYVYIKAKQYRALLFAIFFATAAMLFANTFIATRLNPLVDASSSRYYYIPSVLISVFWAMVLTTFFTKKYSITLTIAAVFFVVNAIIFNNHFKEVLRRTNKTKTIISYITNNLPSFAKDSLIVVGPSAVFGPYEAGFYTYHLGRERNIMIKTQNVDYSDWRPIASTSAHLTTINYDENCSCKHIFFK